MSLSGTRDALRRSDVTKVTQQSLLAQKQNGAAITALTAYDYPTARLVDEAGIDVLLVGDSLGMAVLGHDDTLSVTMDYIKIGDKRVHLRGSKGGEGKGSLGSAVALTVLFGPLGLLARGADITIPAGQKVNCYIDVDTDVSAPLAAPPKV